MGDVAATVRSLVGGAVATRYREGSDDFTTFGVMIREDRDHFPAGRREPGPSFLTGGIPEAS